MLAVKLHKWQPWEGILTEFFTPQQPVRNPDRVGFTAAVN